MSDIGGKALCVIESLEIRLMISESPLSHVIPIFTAVSVNAADVKVGAHHLTVSSETVLSVIAPVSVTDVESVPNTANAGITSLDLDKDFISLSIEDL